MHGHLLTNPGVCSGCRACELVCSFWHTRSYAPDLSSIWVDKHEPSGSDIPHVCRQCDEPLCIAACVAGALTRDSGTGAIRLDDAVCIGCGECVAACGGSLRINPTSGKPLCCDLCGGAPRCAMRCPTGAVVFEPCSIERNDASEGGD